MKRVSSVLILLCIVSFTLNAQTDFANNQLVENDFANYLKALNATGYAGSMVPTFTRTQETVGTRYLFNKWVNGSVTSQQDTVYAKSTYLFNYDKVARSLFFTEDKKLVIEIYPDQIKSFSLKDGANTWTFEHVYIIDNVNFYQLLVKSDKGYTLYKLLLTKLTKSNFSTNGILESGHNYDEFKDQISYFVILPGGKKIRKVELTRKSVMQALSSERHRVEAYFSEYEPKPLNEGYLTQLIRNLNK